MPAGGSGRKPSGLGYVAHHIKLWSLNVCSPSPGRANELGFRRGEKEREREGSRFAPIGSAALTCTVEVKLIAK